MHMLWNPGFLMPLRHGVQSSLDKAILFVDGMSDVGCS